MVNLGPPPSIWPTGALTGGGGGAGRGGKSRSHQACESPPPASPSPERERVEDGRTRTRSPSPSSPRSDFGPFNAMRPFDDADPRDLVGEGWNSDADWGYGGPEPCCSPPLAPLDGGLTSRTSSSSSVGSDPGPFSAMGPLDDADPRELAREGWDSGADWDCGGPETGCPSPLAPWEAPARKSRVARRTYRATQEKDGSAPVKQGRRQDSGSYEAPPRRSKRLQDREAPRNTLESPSDPQELEAGAGANREGGHNIASPIDARSPSPTPTARAQGGRKRPPPESDSFFEDGHHPGISRLRKGRPLRGKRDLRPRACRQGANEVGLLLRTVDPSLLDDTALSGDTSLSLAQVAQCLCRMLKMASSRHAHGAENLLPWHTDCLSSAELGFPLVVDQFHRDVHPLIRQYVCAQIRAGDQTLGPLLRLRGGIGNDHCEICDQGTGRGLLFICDQCECT